MKILYVHQYFSTPSGSTGTRPYEMALRLIARGHQVTMVCGGYLPAESGLKGDWVNGMRQGRVDGIDVIELSLPPSSNYDSFLKRSWIFFLYSWRSVLLALQEKYDLIFASSTPLTSGIPGIVARYFRRKPFVFEVRDLFPELPKTMGMITNPIVLGALGGLEWLSYHSAVGCIGLSPGIIQGIANRGVSTERIEMVPNGCDLELFKSGIGKGVIPEGVREEDFIAVFTGAHGIPSGLHAVLDAARILKERGRTDIKLVFIGEGKLKIGLLKRAELEDLSNCIFLNPVSKTTLTSYLKAADAGLMVLANIPAFYYGTSPNKFFDYIASGLPVINNYSGWLSDMITENNCGLSVEGDNPEAFAAALEQMADNIPDTKQMGVNARKLAEREFGRDKLGDRFVDFLEKMVRQ
ncbi:MAG: glycosyltransferase family 4 protein [Chlorobiaceae bacterium]